VYVFTLIFFSYSKTHANPTHDTKEVRGRGAGHTATAGTADRFPAYSRQQMGILPASQPIY